MTNPQRSKKRFIAAAFFTLVGLGFVAAVANKPPQPSQEEAAAALAALPEPDRVRAAVNAKGSCTTGKLNFVGRDNTGAGYMAGCGGSMYFVIVKPSNQIEVTYLAIKCSDCY